MTAEAAEKFPRRRLPLAPAKRSSPEHLAMMKAKIYGLGVPTPGATTGIDFKDHLPDQTYLQWDPLCLDGVGHFSIGSGFCHSALGDFQRCFTRLQRLLGDSHRYALARVPCPPSDCLSFVRICHRAILSQFRKTRQSTPPAPVSGLKSDGGVPLQIHAYPLAIRDVFVSTILFQQGQRNTYSWPVSLTRSDRDHAISMLQAAQIGEAKFSIDRLNRSGPGGMLSASSRNFSAQLVSRSGNV
jgi:hypothetical protein